MGSIKSEALRRRNRSARTEMFAILVGLNDKLADLPDDPVEIQSHSGSNGPDDLILARVEAFEVEGKHSLAR